MALVNEKNVLNFYIEQIDKDEISFLKGRHRFKSEIKKYIGELKEAENINEKIEASKKLWKVLFEAAMSYIDPDKRGYDELFKYFDEYVEFEELIFASDSFYRDHTVHCLWVYFLGEYITKTEKYNFLFKNFSNQLNQVKAFKEVLEKIGIENKLKDVSHAFDEFIKAENNDDSIRCISALTHDLGYPIKKISKINKSMSKILPYFSINNFDEFNFQFDNIQKSSIDSFIDLISNNEGSTMGNDDSKTEALIDSVFSKIMRIEHGEFVGANKEGVNNLTDEEINVIKHKIDVHFMLNRVQSSYSRYCRDFEEYQHGIMSAFLLTKVVKAFTNITLIYTDKGRIGAYDVAFSDLQAKTAILRAVSDHTSSNYRITDIMNHSALLTFIDELEEFSRISRANQSRQYVSEFCKTDIYVEDGVFNIDFIFDNEELDNLDPEKAFKGRCKRFLTLFDIPKLNEDLKLRVRCIGRLSYDNNIYSLEIGRKYAKIIINDEEKNIPEYLKSRQFYTREGYAAL